MNRRLSAHRSIRVLMIAVLLFITIVIAPYRFNRALVGYAQGDGQVTHSVNGKTERWTIKEPNVKQHVTPYPQIRFQIGDRITIIARGCVQTGGVGRTWKDYVDPRGPNADRLYHGLIWIPGVIGGRAATGVPPDPKRIAAYTGTTQAVVVPPGVDTKELYLRLGYEDDDYSDNGYYSHDDGTQDQCKGSVNAFVTIDILHGVGGGATQPNLPFDLVWDSEDDNGIPLNPKWGWQVTHPGARPDPRQCPDGPFSGECTSWSDIVTKDTADICAVEQYEPGKSNEPPLFGIAGHVNWAAGTYIGRLTWEGHSTPTLSSPLDIDDDYNMDLFPTGDAGLVSVRGNIEVEFDSDETVDHFSATWWDLLHRTVDHNSNSAVNNSLFTEPGSSPSSPGLYSIVTGLIGLEMCHSGSNELHPAWAMAIRVKDADPADEVWAMFVRRFGDEGFCSGNQHFLTDLPGDTYTFRLPWRPGATSVNIGSATSFLQTESGGSGPGFQAATNQGLLVSFKVPPTNSDDGDIIYGELHLQWPGGKGPAPIPSGKTNRFAGAVGRTIGATDADVDAPEPEERLAAALAKLPVAQRSQFAAFMTRRAITPHSQPLQPGTITRIASLPVKPARPRRQQYRSVPDQAKIQKNQRLLNLVRQSVPAKKAR